MKKKKKESYHSLSAISHSPEEFSRFSLKKGEKNKNDVKQNPPRKEAQSVNRARGNKKGSGRMKNRGNDKNKHQKSVRR